jgi:NADH dehydrogenase/NADH:ubiquinone oxidoreductase subunit G
MPKVKIDGFEVEVPEGTTILNAARQIGGDIVPPAMCYYSTLKGSGGKCRTCLVKVTKGSERDPRPMPKLVASCQTPVMDGMEVANISSDGSTQRPPGCGGIPAAQPPAGLPHLRPGRRMPPPGPLL